MPGQKAQLVLGQGCSGRNVSLGPLSWSVGVVTDVLAEEMALSITYLPHKNDDLGSSP